MRVRRACRGALRERWANELKALRSSSVSVTGVGVRPLRMEHFLLTETTPAPSMFHLFLIRDTGSRHMGRRVSVSREVLKVLHRGTTVERLTRSKGVELVGKGVEPTAGVAEAVGVEVPSHRTHGARRRFW